MSGGALNTRQRHASSQGGQETILFRRRPRFASRMQGAALVVLMALLTLGVLYFLTVQLEALGGYEKESRAASDSLAQAREALLAYAATYRDDHSGEVFGYLPCPDTSGDGSADTALTTVECGSSGHASIGLLPYRTLRLPDLRDSAGVCLWYAVSGNFKAAVTKATPMNWDTQGQFTVLDSGGATLVTPEDAQGGAAAVIFATGLPLAGQSRGGTGVGPCRIDPTQVAAFLDGAYSFASSSTISVTQGPVKDVYGGITNNDRLAWVSPKEIFDRIVKRKDFGNASTGTPPGQINTLTSEIKTVWEKKIQDDLVAGTTSTSQPANTASFTQPAGKQVGTLPSSLTLNDGGYAVYYDNWAGLYRQALCSSLGTPCLSVAGTSCRGALMFGGRNAGGQPRTAAQQAFSTANLDHYFEAGSGLEILNSTATTFAGLSAYTEDGTPAGRALDVGTCLFPGAFKSFAQDIAGFQSGVVTSGTPAASVDTGSKTVTTGSYTASASSACVWYPTALPLDSMLRLYFRVQFVDKGRGLTLALADAATNLAPLDGSRSQVMCGSRGASGSHRLGYGGIPSGGTTAGIHSPKLGLEFDTAFESGASDPHRDHIAFLFWGGSADSSPTGSGDDDTTQYAGAGGTRITGASWASGMLTLTTATAHGLSVSEVVTIAGVLPAAANGSYMIQTVPSSSQFTVSVAKDPGAYSSGGIVRAASTGTQPRNPRVATAIMPAISVTNASYDVVNDRVTIETGSVGHGFQVGQQVYITGIYPKAFGGVRTVLSSGLRSTAPCAFGICRFRYSEPTNPGSYSSGGVVVAGTEISALSATTAPNTAHATSPAAHGIATGRSITTLGATPAGFGTTAALTSTGLTTFDYPLGSDLSASTFAAESPAGMLIMNGAVPYMSSSNSLPITTTTVPYTGSGWQDTVIQVRLDITRRYDSTNQMTVLGMKAYIGDQGGTLPDTCSVSDFKDLSRDLSDICPYRAVTLHQDSVPISNLASVSGATWDSATQTVTVTTGAGHGLAHGATITLSGATPSAYNGTYTIAVTGTNTFTYLLASNPGTWTTGGAVQALTNLYLGFTTARSTADADDQNVVISSLLIRSQ